MVVYVYSDYWGGYEVRKFTGNLDYLYDYIRFFPSSIYFYQET